MQINSETRLSFLIVRRDNIGDLVCTTPLISSLREYFPYAQLSALVNSYSKGVLDNSSIIDHVFWYTKAKHQTGWKRKLIAHWQRLLLIVKLRRMKFDYVILASPGFQPRSLSLIKWIGAKHIIGYVENDNKHNSCINLGIPYVVPRLMHEVEDVFRLLVPLGIEGEPPATKIFPDEKKVLNVRALIKNQAWESELKIGIHISARKVSQRWPADRFVELIRALHAEYNANILLFWSPGDDTNPFHPGDDDKAKIIMEDISDVSILAYPTQELGALIAGLSLCHLVICSDGGAMHLATGLGKSIVCFFGNSESTRWHPWKVPYVLLQPESQNVTDISIEEALSSVKALLNNVKI